ncbi:MAG TPA: alpha/beta hydrolase [Allocoleopsis sp.]
MNRTSASNDRESLISVIVGSVALDGKLEIPQEAQGVVLFTGSSPCNRRIAHILHQARLGTLTIDLLTPHEQAIDRWMRYLHFDLGLLAERLVGVTDWLLENPATQNLRIGYLVTSTDSGAAILAALERPEAVGAIVSWQGRPDLAGSALSRVQVPTLLIAAGDDLPHVALNQAALMQLHTEHQLEVIPGAMQRCQVSGVVEDVANLTAQWCDRFLLPVEQQDLKVLVQRD